MRAYRRFLIGVATSALWPLYLALVGYAARQAPWPRSTAVLVGALLASLSVALFAANLARWMFRPEGWVEEFWQLPPDVARQVFRTLMVLLAAAVVLLIPYGLLSGGMLAAEGRPIAAAEVCRGLCLGFEITVWASVFCLVRRSSPLIAWALQSSRFGEWLGRHHRALAGSLLGAVGTIILLDVRGYSFTSQRLALGACQTIAVMGFSWGVYKLLSRLIDLHTWRWIHAIPADSSVHQVGEASQPDDLAERLRRLAAYLVPVVAVFGLAWTWNVDLALFEFLGKQPLPLWINDSETVTVGDATRAALALLISIGAWRHMSTFLAVSIFPRMSNDPVARFAMVTLCRYIVLAIGLLTGLSAVHLGVQKISVVLAALGVGLGFGLQEVVSNFVCGIILLLERPIRIGDIVTVAGNTGKVDRINIRATTIINADNQSMIVPNREFITGNLINWTHKDKILRVQVRVSVAFGVDPERVAATLLAIAEEDPDVLGNPVPVALMDGFGDSALDFQLAVFVPDPSLTGRVRHRLCTRIQQRFDEEGLRLAYPTRELHLRSVPLDSILSAQGHLELFRNDSAAAAVLDVRATGEKGSVREDVASPTPPVPHPHFTNGVPAPSPATPCHRGVDE